MKRMQQSRILHLTEGSFYRITECYIDLNDVVTIAKIAGDTDPSSMIAACFIDIFDS
jgi:hypothetical protein